MRFVRFMNGALGIFTRESFHFSRMRFALVNVLFSWEIPFYDIAKMLAVDVSIGS